MYIYIYMYIYMYIYIYIYIYICYTLANNMSKHVQLKETSCCYLTTSIHKTQQHCCVTSEPHCRAIAWPVVANREIFAAQGTTFYRHRRHVNILYSLAGQGTRLSPERPRFGMRGNF